MNVRLQKYKKNRLAGMNQYNAARAAGYSHNTARRACVIEKSAKLSMVDAFEQAGVTDKFLIEYAMEGLKATKLFGKDADVHEDWTSRHRFFETILKMTDRLKDKVEHFGLPETQINVYPSKTFVFRDLKNDETPTDFRRLHEPQSASGVREEGAVQGS